MSQDRLATLPTETLVARSIEVLERGQTDSGAYLASPTYPTYRYAWLRDGSFCADAMDRVGHHDSAARFHGWVGRTVNAHRDEVLAAIRAAGDGEPDPHRMLPTRFTPDGQRESGEEGWPNFQLDGYGTWLWAVERHLRVAGRPPSSELLEAVTLVAGYLAATAHLPCYDCWEEFGDRRHTSTRGAIVAGLRAAAELTGDRSVRERADELRSELLADHVHDGSFVKSAGDDRVDASLLWLVRPFGVVDVDEPLARRTIERVRDELSRPGRGVRRYLGDTFYGGGDWVLLTAWLGWCEAVSGEETLARERLAWIESAATPDGHLPEQLTDAPQAPERVDEWVQRWGRVATPLLWSHAMYLVLVDALSRTGEAA